MTLGGANIRLHQGCLSALHYHPNINGKNPHTVVVAREIVQEQPMKLR
jgi:hypothetical protein